MTEGMVDGLEDNGVCLIPWYGDHRMPAALFEQQKTEWKPVNKVTW